MSSIRCKEDLRRAYQTVSLLEDIAKSVTGREEYEKANNYLISLKLDIRKYNKRKSDSVIIQGDYDGYIELITFPDDVTDPEAYFEEEYKLTCKPSQYDCTGQEFTSWYKIFKRRGKTMCYHRVGRDV